MPINKTRKRQNRFRVNKRLVAIMLALLIFAIPVSGGWWLWSTGLVNRAIETLRSQFISASLYAGFEVDEILVVGRNETRRDKLFDAIRLVRGAPIFSFDLDAARDRVEALPWISRASIERFLPDTILINIEERQPAALWQYNGKFSLIDRNGAVILNRDLHRFSHLVVVVGKEASIHASNLLDFLGAAPELEDMVKSAVWVGGRRWNLHLKGDIYVQLPEENPKSAWIRLGEYERAHRVLERNVKVLDLRIPDRLIVRKRPRRVEEDSKGRET